MMCVVRPVHDLRWHGLPQDGRVLNIGHEQSCQRACHGSLASATLASAPADAAHTIPGPVAKSFSMGSYKGHAGTIVNRRHACYYQHMYAVTLYVDTRNSPFHQDSRGGDQQQKSEDAAQNRA